ncbi:DUF4397 domain-containing protein [Pontibacter toksunensis]|uniref:DUF4397 domain-containing protein n=1 Tax=Pontibacter toksunensis TaxID=1332631 RepID=A0ABW6C0V2_9BACT
MKKISGKLFLSKFTILLSSVFTFSLTSCLEMKDADDDIIKPATYIAIYHGAPDAPDVDIFVDNTRINNQSFKYANYSDYFNFVAPGNHRLKFTPVNASNALIDTALTFKEGDIYSLFLVDRLQEVELLAVEDSLITPGANEVGLRVVQLSPDAPAMDIVLVKSSTNTSFSTNMDFRDSTPFRKTPSGTHTVQLRDAGSEELLLAVPNITLEAGRNYSFIVRGFTSPPTGSTNVLSLQVIRNY